MFAVEELRFGLRENETLVITEIPMGLKLCGSRHLLGLPPPISIGNFLRKKKSFFPICKEIGAVSAYFRAVLKCYGVLGGPCNRSINERNEDFFFLLRIGGRFCAYKTLNRIDCLHECRNTRYGIHFYLTKLPAHILNEGFFFPGLQIPGKVPIRHHHFCFREFFCVFQNRYILPRVPRS